MSMLENVGQRERKSEGGTLATDHCRLNSDVAVIMSVTHVHLRSSQWRTLTSNISRANISEGREKKKLHHC